MTPLQSAFRHHKWLLVYVVIYCACTVAEALYFHVPLDNLLDIVKYMALSTIMPISLLSGFYFGAFFGYLATAPREGVRKAFEKLQASATAYASGKPLAYAFIGFLVLYEGNFFLLAKSMIVQANPYKLMKWDLDFVAWDRALHFGYHPYSFIIRLVNGLHMGPVLDWMYFFWFLVMTLALGFNLFGDRLLHRRLRFLWGYVLAWTIIGSIMATIFSSCGPVFYNLFFREEGGPYDMLIANTQMLQHQSPLFAEMTRKMLMGWVRNHKLFNPNAISAMPSMHMAISWLIVLYAREIGRWWFAAALVFSVLIYLGAVYFGFHYAIDCYVSLVCISLIWWLTGKCLDRRYPRDLRMEAVE